MENLDYIIIGGGLAGSLCSERLQTLQQKVLVISDPNIPSSSAIAAGTWNPIAFKRFLLSWRAEEFIKEMHLTYSRIEQLLGNQYYQKYKVQKIITPGNELDLWREQSAKNEMGVYMNSETTIARFPEGMHQGEIKNTGKLNLKPLLQDYHRFLQKEQNMLFDTFDYEQLTFKDGHWHYKNYSSSKIIFCEGSHVFKNKYFNWLPIKPAKGEVITIECPGLNMDYILKKNIFILPLGEDKYEVGATYEWKELTWETTEKGRSILVEKLKTLLPFPFKVIDQRAGIRPTSYDRRIIMGEHPIHKGLHVFNGLGTKGVMLAPLAVKEFCNHLVHGVALNPEMDVHRCKKYFSL